jgi:nucleotide-binding universal stress UspA family protein
LASAPRETKIRQILVAVDGSEYSMRAVKVASKIAKDNNASLVILHVLTIPAAAYGEFPTPDRIEQQVREAGEKFLAAATAFAQAEGIQPASAFVQHMDSPVRGITDYAENNGIDLIVVGTRGLGGFKRLILGSVASGVVHYAHCSVLVVR